MKPNLTQIMKTGAMKLLEPRGTSCRSSEMYVQRNPAERSRGGRKLLLAALLALTTGVSRADETCQSPYMPKIVGQEQFVYVWTLGVEGWGDGSDKLVSVDVKPDSPNYGKVIHSTSVGGRHEAHHGGFTDDRRELWCSGLDT